MSLQKVLYRATATATGGRDGRARTTDSNLDVKLAAPKEMGGSGEAGTNPEQLFAAGWAACFLGALKFAARREKIEVSSEASVEATVGIGPLPTGFGLEAQLRVRVPGMEPEHVKDLMEKAHVICPYSNATRGNIDVKLEVG